MWIVKILQKPVCNPEQRFDVIQEYLFDDFGSALVFYDEWNRKYSNCRMYACYPEFV